jgi:hypothetical protein
MKPNWQPLVIAFLLVVSTVALRGPWLHHAIWTLDEGSTFTMAQQVLEGDVIYRDAADNRSPLVPYLKAIVFALSGDWNAVAVYWIIALALGGCAVLIAWITRKFTDGFTGTAAGIAFVILQFYFIDSHDMMSANTEWFVVIFSTIGFTIFVAAIDEQRLGRGLLAGLCFGASVLCKQPGLLDFVAVSVLLLILGISRSANRINLAKLWLIMASGVALPLLCAGVYLSLNGAFEDYIYYAFTFNTTVYVPEIPLAERFLAIRKPFQMAGAHVPVFAVLGVLGLSSVIWICVRGLFRRPVAVELFPWLVLGWTVSGLIATTLSGREFAHYSEQLIPGFAMLVARGAAVLRSGSIPKTYRFTPWVWRIVLIGIILQCGYRYRMIARELNAELTPGSHPIAEIVQRYSAPHERIFVWGYYPEIYFYAQRLPATRFIYANFITGMIAWTNIDAMQDTANGVVPGGWDKFYQDFAAKPPSVIVDTGYLRNYVKFPLSQGEPLWSNIQANYAEVSLSNNPGHERYFRRLIDNSSSRIPPTSIPVDSRLRITGFASPQENEPPRIEVQGPAGFERLELLRNNRVVSTLPYPAVETISARFFVPHDLLDDTTAVTIRASGPTGVVQSDAFDFGSFSRDQLAARSTEPALEFNEARLPPARLYTSLVNVTPHDAIPGTWELHAPARIVYNCPTEVDRISFIHGLKSSVVPFSDGYDLQVTWIAPDGSSIPIWEKRITPRTGKVFQSPMQEDIELPPRGSGQLEFRFYSGQASDTHNDNLFFGHLKGHTAGPVIALGEYLAVATPDSLSGEGPLRQGSEEEWIASVPTKIKWSVPTNLMSLSFNYGIRPEAYDPNGDSHSNGVLFKLELNRTNGSTEILFERLLEPYNHPDHRGPQSAQIELPRDADGELVFSTGPGWDDDASWDWAWIASIRAEAPGPPLVISPTRRIVVTKTAGFDHGWANKIGENRWGAQSPQFLTYAKPVDLVEITLSYGLNDNAAADENGQRRSDGVDVVVVFIDANGSSRELFRHSLDPFSTPADFGIKTSTIPLPPGETGQLVIGMEPGPNGDNSYDWAFWGPLSGRVFDHTP